MGLHAVGVTLEREAEETEENVAVENVAVEREAVAREAAREEAGLEVGSAVAVAMEEAGSVVEPTEVAREAAAMVVVG